VLEHEVFIVLDREAGLLVGVGCVLFKLELELVDEHLGLFLVGLGWGGGLVSLLNYALEKLLRLELDNRFDPKQRLADIRRFIIRAIGKHVPIRHSIAEKVVVSPLSEMANMNCSTKM
jgi:hypothetical protein